MGGSWFRYLLAPIPRGRRSCTSCWEFDPAGFSKKRAFREYHLSVVFALVSCRSSLMVLSGCCSSTRERWRGVPLLCIHCARNVVARGRCRLCICVQGEARFTGSLPFHDPEENKEKQRRTRYLVGLLGETSCMQPFSQLSSSYRKHNN